MPFVVGLKGEKMARLKLLEMDIDNKMIYFRKDDKIVAFDADAAVELIADVLDDKRPIVVRCKDCRWQNTPMCWITYRKLLDDYDFCCCGERREDVEKTN